METIILIDAVCDEAYSKKQTHSTCDGILNRITYKLLSVDGDDFADQLECSFAWHCDSGIQLHTKRMTRIGDEWREDERRSY